VKIHDELQEERPKVSAILHDIDKLLPYVSNVHTALLTVHCRCTHTHTHREGKNGKEKEKERKGGSKEQERKRDTERDAHLQACWTQHARARAHTHILTLQI